MTEVIQQALRKITSGERALSYIDDPVLIGPADDIARVLQELPRALTHAGLSRKHNCGLRAPSSSNIRSSGTCRNRWGLVIFGEALGDNPTDPYLVGAETFIQDHLQGVADAVANDLRKLAILPDKLDGDMAGIQVVWALLAKTLPPGAQELRNTLQEAMIDTVQQCLEQPIVTADQLHVAQLPLTAFAGGLAYHTCPPSPWLREHRTSPRSPAQKHQPVLRKPRPTRRP